MTNQSRRQSGLYAYSDIWPSIDDSAWIAPGARVIGDVTIGAKSGVWFNAVIRGDVAPVTIGHRTNIQDGTIIHVTRNGHPTMIGDDVTIGHNATIHACHLSTMSFVGMGAVILDDVMVESGAMVAAGALVTSGKVVKSGEVWAGNPAKKMRDLTEKESDFIAISARNYVQHVQEYTLM